MPLHTIANIERVRGEVAVDVPTLGDRGADGGLIVPARLNEVSFASDSGGQWGQVVVGAAHGVPGSWWVFTVTNPKDATARD